MGHMIDFYGRTGYPLSASGGVAFYEWNDAGMLTKDPSRGITAIKYNPQGQPTKVDFADGTYVSYKYTCDSELINASTYGKKTGIFPPLLADRSYCGNFELDLYGVTRVNFPSGYFDDMCNVYYRHADWQGSVDMVTDGSGAVVQHNGYYPYGEPWREPAGQPYLYGGKERMRDNGLNEYDFSARRYNSALALWTTPDPLAEKFAHVNPLTYCAGNPIRYVDKTGKWYGEVKASPDRAAHPYAVFTAYTNDGIKIFQTVVKVKGTTKGSNRRLENADTPTGTYKILGWRKTGREGGYVMRDGELKLRYPEGSFGKNDLLALDYISGEALGSGRVGIHMHGGGIKQGPELSTTLGCIRISDEDIKALKEITDEIQKSDSTETPTTITVSNDLDENVTYADDREPLRGKENIKDTEKEKANVLLMVEIFRNINDYLR